MISAHRENKFDDFKEEVLLPHKLSTNGPFSVTADVNGDNLEDVFIGGASGQEGVLFLQTTNGKFLKSKSKPWAVDKKSEDLSGVFFDIDSDGDKDLYVTSGGSEFKQGSPLLKDRVYMNDGLGNFRKKNQAVPNIYKSTQTVKVSDIDADGDLDLFIGTRLISGKYTFPATSYILINNNGILKEAPKKTAQDLINIGMVTDAVFSDIDNDGDEDLLIVGEWMEIKVLENDNGVFKFIFEQLSLNKKLSIDDLGYLIGPIINSGGRLGFSNYGVELLTTDSLKLIKKRSIELIKLNEKRKLLEQNILDQIDYEKIKEDYLNLNLSKDLMNYLLR